jgi:ATP-dependent HslUV protease subunit HslV
MTNMHSTTIVAVRREGKVALAGDGQVTLGHTVMKGNAKKIRRLYKNRVITGFAGAVADAFTLYDRFEKKLESYGGDLVRACVSLTSDWRTDKYLRQLEAMLIVADAKHLLLLSGTGEVIEPQDEVLAIGSGGDFARASALALYENTEMSAAEIARKSLEIAGKICIYTNTEIILEEIESA